MLGVCLRNQSSSESENDCDGRSDDDNDNMEMDAFQSTFQTLINMARVLLISADYCLSKSVLAAFYKGVQKRVVLDDK